MLSIKKEYRLLNAALLLGALTLVLSYSLSSPQVAKALGVSLASSTTLVNFIDMYGWAVTVMTWVAIVSGVGSIGGALVATVLRLLRKKAKAEVALW